MINKIKETAKDCSIRPSVLIIFTVINVLLLGINYNLGSQLRDFKAEALERGCAEYRSNNTWSWKEKCDGNSQ